MEALLLLQRETADLEGLERVKAMLEKIPPDAKDTILDAIKMANPRLFNEEGILREARDLVRGGREGRQVQALVEQAQQHVERLNAEQQEQMAWQGAAEREYASRQRLEEEQVAILTRTVDDLSSQVRYGGGWVVMIEPPAQPRPRAWCCMRWRWQWCVPACLTPSASCLTPHALRRPPHGLLAVGRSQRAPRKPRTWRESPHRWRKTLLRRSCC